MKEGDKIRNSGQRINRHESLDFMRHESIRLDRIKADRQQAMRIQHLRSDFKGYYQQIEGIIKPSIETLPAQVKASFSHAMQEYKKLTDDFRDVIDLANSDQPATKPSDYLTPRLLDLERSARNAQEARLNDAVNQIRPFHQKLMYQVLLAQYREATKRTDQLRQASAKNQSFKQEHEKQRNTIREMAIKMNQDIKILSEKYRQFLQMKDFFPREAEETFLKIEKDIDAYNSIFNDNVRNYAQTKVSDLLNAYATLSDSYRAISEGIGNLETTKNSHEQQRLLQERSKTLEASLKALKKDIERKNFEEEQRQILERAKPSLTSEADKAFCQLEKLHSQIKHEIAIPDIDDQHREAFEKLLGYLSPDTLRDFQQRNVKFVVDLDAKVFYPTVAKDESGQWQIKISMPYPYGMHGLMLRAIDLLLEIHQQQDGRIPSPELRAEVAARAFRANERMGKDGFHRQGYEMAEMYYNDYETGIRQAFAQKLIDTNTPENELEEIGYNYALQEYLKSAQPKGDIPVFPGMQPGAYFEESGEWDLNEGQRPVEVGSEAFDDMMQKLNARRLEGNNFTLTANILPPDANSSDTTNKILVQPFYAMEGLRSHHPINAGGKHTLWAGEIDINYETKTVLRIKDQSGHFRTFVQDKPYLMIDYALNEFQARGYDTSNTDKQLTFLVGHQEVSYRNYRPPINPNKPMEAIDAEQVRRGEAPEDMTTYLQWMHELGTTKEA